MVFPTFFNFSLNFAIRSLWSEPQSAPDFVFADFIELFHLQCKEHNLISVLTIWWCTRVESSLGLLETGVCYDQPVLFDKTLLAFALFHFVLQGQTPGISWVSTSAFQSPVVKRTPFLVLVLEGVVFIELVNLSLSGISGWGTGLDYHDTEWFVFVATTALFLFFYGWFLF